MILKYYEGQLQDSDNLKNDELKDMRKKEATKQKEEKSLLEEKIKPKKHVQPIL